MSFDNPGEAKPDRLVGTTVGGRYKIVSKLGEGGMGAVYVGEQHLGTTVRKVAVKTLHEHLSHDPKILARFERECATVAELHHPNTIQVFDFGKTDDGTLFIVMEFVEGRSVADVLEKEGPMEPGRVERILTQVCGSLAEAHQRGIVHRDLKPDNIVLCTRAGQTDWVEVLDFGIAKRSNEEDKNEAKLTQQGMVLGTPPYMSPEQFTGKPIDARSDVYSLGVMAYEMLTGRLPFMGNTAWEWASAHMTAPPAPIESTPQGASLPARMKAAITKALAKLPDERFASVMDFLSAFTSGGPAVAAPAVSQDFARGKTEVGTPLQAPAAAYTPAPMSPPVTPHAGNHAMSAGVPGVPAAPPRDRGGSGGGKGPLLAVAGVVAVLSIGAIALAMRGSSSTGAPGIDLGGYEAGLSAPATVLTGATAAQTATGTATAPAPEVDAALADIVPTKPTAGGGAGGTKPATKKDGGAAAGTAGGAGGTPGGAAGGAGGTPGGTTPPAALPKACEQAKLMYSMQQKAAGDRLAEQCKAQGGHL